MKVLIVYDSYFGNTARVAQAIASTLEGQTPVVCHIDEVKAEHLQDLDVLVVGSPTRGFRPTRAIRQLLRDLPSHGLVGTKVAAFDTRIEVAEINNRILPALVKIFGYAADPIARRLRNRGGKLMMPPEGFIVEDAKGPLKEGELERAAWWAERLVS